MSTGNSLLGEKRPGREADLSPPCNALRAVATAIGSHNYYTDVQRPQEGSGLILMLCDSLVCGAFQSGSSAPTSQRNLLPPTARYVTYCGILRL